MAKRKAEDWFPMYVWDFQHDTIELSPEHLGAYMRLLMALYSARRPLPMKNKIIRSITGLSDYKMKSWMPVFVKFFDIDDGYFMQKRVAKELRIQDEFAAYRTEKARNNGLKGRRMIRILKSV